MSDQNRTIRLQFTLKQLLAAVTLFALLLGLWFATLGRSVQLTDATNDPESARRTWHFPAVLPLGLSEEGVRPRSLFLVEGRFFPNGRCLRSKLFLVEHKEAAEMERCTLGESSSRLLNEFGSSLRIRVALGDAESSDGHLTVLGAVGYTRAVSSSGPMPHDVQRVFAKVFPGPIRAGTPYIVYVEGDREPVADRGMTVQDFAASNAGSFLVVTAEFK